MNWWEKRVRAFHMTIRDIDCGDFDVPQFITDLVRMRVNVVTFGAGGYCAVYQTKVPFHVKSPWLGERDLVRELTLAGHPRGIKFVPSLDLGAIPVASGLANPEWLARDRDGNPYYHSTAKDLFVSCPLSPYQDTYAYLLIRELLEDYEVDGIKFGGGSYSFGQDVCHCSTCRKQFRADTGYQLPEEEDWDDPVWRGYMVWKFEKTEQIMARLTGYCQEIRSKCFVMGNGVSYGDPGWMLRAGLDLTTIAQYQTIIQSEVQTRQIRSSEGRLVGWQPMWWPAETANFLTTVTERPVWLATSYFLAWPWRRVAVPAVEEKVYLAEGVANGASPIVNLSGGPPAVHEDKRGFAGIQSLYEFMEENDEYLSGDCSLADVALVFSRNSLAYGFNAEPETYLAAVRGFHQALTEHHIPFDIISDEALCRPGYLDKYRVVLLPETICLDDDALAATRAFVEAGGGLVATGKVSLRDAAGNQREQFGLSDLLGASDMGYSVDASYRDGPTHSYVRPKGSQLWAGLEQVELLPNATAYRAINVDGARTLATLLPTFRVFPEVLASPVIATTSVPLVIGNTVGEGEVLYFANSPGEAFYAECLPDWGRAIANAVTMVRQGPVQLQVKAPSSVHISLRQKDDTWLVHFVNVTSASRYFRELIPISDIELSIPLGTHKFSSSRLLGSKDVLEGVERDGNIVYTLPPLLDYEILALS